MKNIFLAFLLYYSFSASAQQSTLDRCELTYDSVGYCKDGIPVTGYIYKEGSHFSGSAAAVMNYQNKSALLNEQGKEITPFIYDGLVPCYNFPGWFACKIGNNMGIINDKGKELIPVKYQAEKFDWVFSIDGGAAYFDSNSYFVFAQNGKYGLVDCFGKIKCDFKYDQIEVYYLWQESTKITKAIVVKEKNKIKIMHANGIIDTKLEYDAFLGFWGDDIVLRKAKKIEFINALTWSVVKTHIDKEDGNTGRLFVVEENTKKGLIDSTGKILTPIIYDYVKCLVMPDNLSKSLIAVENDTNWGVYNTNGKEIIPIQYEAIELICNKSDEMFKVMKNEKWAMFQLGKKLSEFKYEDMYCKTDNSAYIMLGEQKGELFFDGKEVWR